MRMIWIYYSEWTLSLRFTRIDIIEIKSTIVYKSLVMPIGSFFFTLVIMFRIAKYDLKTLIYFYYISE